MKIIKDIVRKYYKYDRLGDGRYQKVEWIKSDGNQYILTGYHPNSDTKVETNCIWVNSKPNSPFGNTGSSVFKYGLYINKDNDTFDDYNDDINVNFVSYLGNAKIKIVKDKEKTYINDVLIKTHNKSTFTLSQELRIFGGFYTACTGQNITIYDFIISENGITLYNLVPVYDIQTGDIGLYNTIDNTFLNNKGSGVFTKGLDLPVIEATEDDYDFYKDVDVYKSPEINDKYYASL